MCSVKRFDGFRVHFAIGDCRAVSIGQRCSKWRYRFGDRDRTVGSCNGLYDEAPLAVSTIQELKRITKAPARRSRSPSEKNSKTVVWMAACRLIFGICDANESRVGVRRFVNWLSNLSVSIQLRARFHASWSALPDGRPLDRSRGWKRGSRTLRTGECA